MDLSFAAIILAAGASRRMGQPKLLLPWGKTTVLGHLTRQWQQLGARQVVVVCAGGDRRMQAELDALDFPVTRRIWNPFPERGMFSSIQCAAAWTGWEKDLTHWAVVLGDQPHLREATLRKVLEFAGEAAGRICQPARGGCPRHPVILPRRAFEGLRTSSARDLREFLVGRERTLVEVDDPGLELDIDKPEDYERALKMVRQ